MNAEQASSDFQPKGAWEGRAAPVTVKAMDIALVPERAVELPGVLAVARGDSSMRNRRGPTRRPTSGEADRISQNARNRIGAGRESEGAIVPVKAATNRWREGPLLWSRRVCR